MKLGISKNASVNYLAKIINLTEFTPHPNPEANKLKCCTVDGFNIVCDINSEPGEYVYFPALSQINPQFLSYANQYKKGELNADPTQTGMFEDNGRVKAIKLRGTISEGFVLPISYLINFIVSSTNKTPDYEVGQEFDCVQEGDKEFWINRKYVVIQNQPSQHSSGHSKRSKVKKYSKVDEEQFRFHYDTVLIRKCPQVISPENMIHISTKVHGTSGISAYVRCKEGSHSLLQRFENWVCRRIFDPILGLQTQPLSENRVYDYLYASRTVIKNQYYNENVTSGYYGCDVWAEADKIVRPKLIKGMTAYYEIIGFLPNGNYIQKGFDYGYVQPSANETYTYGKHFGIRIYRVTLTNVDGIVHEFSPREVQIWSKNHDLIPVTELYYGKAKDLYPDLENDINWSDNFIQALSDDSKHFYMECDSPDCVNKVPHEGIVIKNDNMRSEAFKLKCFRFLNKEQKELDAGQANIEDEA